MVYHIQLSFENRQGRELTTPLRPISSPLLIEEIARVLRERIIEGAMPSGTRLSEREIGGKLGVSRTPLREALRLLAGEKLVEVLPRRGASVAPLDAVVIGEIFPVMACLERLAVGLACRHIDAQALAALEVQLARMAAAHARRDKRRFFAASLDFHEAILAAAGNATLWEQHRQLRSQVRRACFLSLSADHEWVAAIDEHGLILAALRRRDGAEAVEAVSRHLDTRRAQALLALRAGAVS